MFDLSKKSKKEYGLPNYMKLGSFYFLIIGIGSLLIAKNYFDLNVKKEFASSITILWMFLFICSRDKEEDEFKVHLRLLSFFSAFVIGTIMVILDPIFNLIDGTNIPQSSSEVLFTMNLFYIISFEYMKRKNK